MRKMVMNCPVDYDETGEQDTTSKINWIMIQQNQSMASSQEYVGNKAKMPPTILKSMARLMISHKMQPRYQ